MFHKHSSILPIPLHADEELAQDKIIQLEMEQISEGIPLEVGLCLHDILCSLI